jgi:hypothetical protein
MSFEEPVPVSGQLVRQLRDGTTETIDMTVDEVQAAKGKYTHEDCSNIKVIYSNGSVMRPYRFIDTQINLKVTIDPETGESHCSW